ncbi:hypothetical protein ACHWQZ_G002578 [Mnemiopsis leidyi]
MDGSVSTPDFGSRRNLPDVGDLIGGVRGKGNKPSRRPEGGANGRGRVGGFLARAGSLRSQAPGLIEAVALVRVPAFPVPWPGVLSHSVERLGRGKLKFGTCPPGGQTTPAPSEGESGEGVKKRGKKKSKKGKKKRKTNNNDNNNDNDNNNNNNNNNDNWDEDGGDREPLPSPANVYKKGKSTLTLTVHKQGEGTGAIDLVREATLHLARRRVDHGSLSSSMCICGWSDLTIFVQSFDTQGEWRTSDTIADQADEVLAKLEPDKVCQIVTDSGEHCRAGRRKFCSRHPWILDSNCAFHSLDLLLEDIYEKIDWFKDVTDKGNNIVTYIRSHNLLRGEFK